MYIIKIIFTDYLVSPSAHHHDQIHTRNRNLSWLSYLLFLIQVSAAIAVVL